MSAQRTLLQRIAVKECWQGHFHWYRRIAWQLLIIQARSWYPYSFRAKAFTYRCSPRVVPALGRRLAIRTCDQVTHGVWKYHLTEHFDILLIMLYVFAPDALHLVVMKLVSGSCCLGGFQRENQVHIYLMAERMETYQHYTRQDSVCRVSNLLATRSQVQLKCRCVIYQQELSRRVQNHKFLVGSGRILMHSSILSLSFAHASISIYAWHPLAWSTIEVESEELLLPRTDIFLIKDRQLRASMQDTGSRHVLSIWLQVTSLPYLIG